jgi:hypothetical protein
MRIDTEVQGIGVTVSEWGMEGVVWRMVVRVETDIIAPTHLPTPNLLDQYVLLVKEDVRCCAFCFVNQTMTQHKQKKVWKNKIGDKCKCRSSFNCTK